jgi:hypothetical protein
MPTLTRLMIWLAVLVSVAYGVMLALVTLVEPRRVPATLELTVEQVQNARPGP